MVQKVLNIITRRDDNRNLTIFFDGLEELSVIELREISCMINNYALQFKMILNNENKILAQQEQLNKNYV